MIRVRIHTDPDTKAYIEAWFTCAADVMDPYRAVRFVRVHLLDGQSAYREYIYHSSLLHITKCRFLSPYCLTNSNSSRSSDPQCMQYQIRQWPCVQYFDTQTQFGPTWEACMDAIDQSEVPYSRESFQTKRDTGAFLTCQTLIAIADQFEALIQLSCLDSLAYTGTFRSVIPRTHTKSLRAALLCCYHDQRQSNAQNYPSTLWMRMDRTCVCCLLDPSEQTVHQSRNVLRQWVILLTYMYETIDQKRWLFNDTIRDTLRRARFRAFELQRDTSTTAAYNDCVYFRQWKYEFRSCCDQLLSAPGIVQDRLRLAFQSGYIACFTSNTSFPGK